MPINTQELMYVLSQLADQNNLRVTVTESAKCGLMAGICAAVGGILMGPVGIAVGGTAGSVFAAVKSSGRFKPVAQVILEDMTPLQQAQLADSCMTIIRDLRVEDAIVLLPLLMNTPSAQKEILGHIVSFVTKEMRLQIVD